MAKTARKHARASHALPPLLERFLARMHTEPRTGPLAALAAGVVALLYASGLGYPLVFADFSVLAPARLDAQLKSGFVLGTSWLSEASFAWSSRLFGPVWSWHRGINLALHAVSVGVAFVLFRRLCSNADVSGPPRVANGWIAFLAACLFALDPAAVYGVAYLSQRTVLFVGLAGLVALWSTARAAQDGWQAAWLVGPLACAAGLACSPSGLGIAPAMGLIALMLRPRDAAYRRVAWASAAIAAVLALVYALALAQSAADTEAVVRGADYLDSLAASSTRFLRYLGFWLLPVTAWMAIDLPEAAISARSAWPGWSAIVLIVLLVLAAALGLRRPGLPRTGAIALACTLALYSVELVWPALGVPFALARGYVWMACACLALACLIARLPVRIAFVTACVVLLAWAALAAGKLQTFSSHAALWDDAVRRAERAGPKLEDARVYLNRAALHRREGHLIAAISDYDKALELDPDQPRALRGRAQAYIDDKRYEAALRDLDRLLVLDPAQSITHADRGLALMHAGRLAEAGNAFDRAIKEGVSEPRVFLNRGLARLRMSGLESAPVALIDIEKALSLDPNYALAYFNRGVIFEEAAKAGLRLRDASSPELMRAVGAENIARACQLGYAPACARARGKTTEEPPPGAKEGPVRISPETLRNQGLLPPR